MLVLLMYELHDKAYSLLVGLLSMCEVMDGIVSKVL